MQLATLFVVTALYGLTMKIADLFNEHGLKPWFRRSDLWFGILWGVLGGALIVMNETAATLVVAMTVAFIVRMRIDYRNHAIATVIILTTTVLHGGIDKTEFLFLLVMFSIFGAVKDYLDDTWQLTTPFAKAYEFAHYYVAVPAAWSVCTGHWLVTALGTTYIVFYDVAKYAIGKKEQRRCS